MTGDANHLPFPVIRINCKQYYLKQKFSMNTILSYARFFSAVIFFLLTGTYAINNEVL